MLSPLDIDPGVGAIVKRPIPGRIFERGQFMPKISGADKGAGGSIIFVGALDFQGNMLRIPGMAVAIYPRRKPIRGDDIAGSATGEKRSCEALRTFILFE
jgi:hypothetical protein